MPGRQLLALGIFLGDILLAMPSGDSSPPSALFLSAKVRLLTAPRRAPLGSTRGLCLAYEEG
jgi:hypothetical protein